MGCISKMAGQGLNPACDLVPTKLPDFGVFIYLFIFAELTDRVYA